MRTSQAKYGLVGTLTFSLKNSLQLHHIENSSLEAWGKLSAVPKQTSQYQMLWEQRSQTSAAKTESAALVEFCQTLHLTCHCYLSTVQHNNIFLWFYQSIINNDFLLFFHCDKCALGYEYIVTTCWLIIQSSVGKPQVGMIYVGFLKPTMIGK